VTVTFTPDAKFVIVGGCRFCLQSARISVELPMMTAPAIAIKDEVHVLIEVQIETFGQPGPLTASQLREYLHRAEKIRTLCQELNRLGTTNVMERLVERASSLKWGSVKPSQKTGKVSGSSTPA
jgi:hypothetical protein